MDIVVVSDHAFYGYLSENRIMGSACMDCGSRFLPPKPLCANCFSRRMTWVEMPKTGKLVAFTIITVVPPAMMKEGFHRKNPYCSGVVELARGLRLDARIIGMDLNKPDGIAIGTMMTAVFMQIDDGLKKRSAPAFKPL